ncbi:DUF349 domain-containing protein [Flavobacterium sp.]|uniref:DUF349 domain-containing protein n=1 Tax=Flavobacterium sp. TaxID=239 RepID=UPI003B9BA2C1
MLEEKHDNLSAAENTTEGNPSVEANTEETLQTSENETSEATQTESETVVEPVSEIETSTPEEPSVVVEEVVEESISAEAEPETVANVEAVEAVAETAVETVELSKEALADEQPILEETQTAAADEAISHIEEQNAIAAEEHERETSIELPAIDYETLDLDRLNQHLERLVKSEQVVAIKEHVELIKSAFLSKFNHLLDEKKQQFHDDPENEGQEFQYHHPAKAKFDELFNAFRDLRNQHFKRQENILKANLALRLAIVEELKNLHNPQEDIKDVLKHFNELRDRWKNAGPIPRDKYNHVWNSYHFHLEKFYDILHLDREARDFDFKHNLELKQNIINRVKVLVEEKDINAALRELQDLHRIWKEDIGPVSKEHRERIWNEFSELSRQIHNKREQLQEQIREREQNNLRLKEAIIQQIESIIAQPASNHNAWQEQVKQVEALREEFFKVGKVPSEISEQVWAKFKDIARQFNVGKNTFYKSIKREQQTNMDRKRALVDKANELKDSDNFRETTEILKQIQEEWKTIGHVPKKFSDQIWKEFRAACNHYFERLKAARSEVNQEETEAYERKKAFLEDIKSFEMTGVHKTDLDNIKAKIEEWKTLGKVGPNKRYIDGKFNKVLDGLFEQLSLSKKDSEMMRFNNRMGQLTESNDSRRIDQERIFLQRKIEEVQAEINQLENNILFFSTAKNAKKENSMVTEVRKSIERHKEELAVLKEKLKQVRQLSEKPAN